MKCKSPLTPLFIVLTTGFTGIFAFISTLTLWTQRFPKLGAVISIIIAIIFVLHWYCFCRFHDELRKEAGWKIEPPTKI
jgi:amino acid permease